MTEPVFPEPLPVWASIRDAVRLYRLLFVRSVLVAAVVFGALALVKLGGHVTGGGTAKLLNLIAGLGAFAGPALVQGALIEIVRNVHEGRAPETARSLFAGSARRILPLVGASFLYAIGIGIGLLLVVVPGLIVLARWSLMPAVVMLERKSVWESRDRSSALIKGRSFEAFLCLLVAFLVLGGGSWAIYFLHLSFGTATFLAFVWESLTAPLDAHLLTVIYYRRADRQRPVIHPDVLTWRSVWEGR